MKVRTGWIVVLIKDEDGLNRRPHWVSDPDVYVDDCGLPFFYEHEGDAQYAGNLEARCYGDWTPSAVPVEIALPYKYSTPLKRDPSVNMDRWTVDTSKKGGE